MFWRSSAGEDVYEGEFRDGKIHGRGTYICADGNRYEGEFRNGEMISLETFDFANSDR